MGAENCKICQERLATGQYIPHTHSPVVCPTPFQTAKAAEKKDAVLIEKAELVEKEDSVENVADSTEEEPEVRIFEFQTPKGKWILFPDDVQSQLQTNFELTYSNKKGNEYHVDLGRMVVYNVENQIERTVRCVDEDGNLIEITKDQYETALDDLDSAGSGKDSVGSGKAGVDLVGPERGGLKDSQSKTRFQELDDNDAEYGDQMQDRDGRFDDILPGNLTKTETGRRLREISNMFEGPMMTEEDIMDDDSSIGSLDFDSEDLAWNGWDDEDQPETTSQDGITSKGNDDNDTDERKAGHLLDMLSFFHEHDMLEDALQRHITLEMKARNIHVQKAGMHKISSGNSDTEGAEDTSISLDGNETELSFSADGRDTRNQLRKLSNLFDGPLLTDPNNDINDVIYDDFHKMDTDDRGDTMILVQAALQHDQPLSKRVEEELLEDPNMWILSMSIQDSIHTTGDIARVLEKIDSTINLIENHIPNLNSLISDEKMAANYMTNVIQELLKRAQDEGLLRGIQQNWGKWQGFDLEGQGIMHDDVLKMVQAMAWTRNNIRASNVTDANDAKMASLSAHEVKETLKHALKEDLSDFID